MKHISPVPTSRNVALFSQSTPKTKKQVTTDARLVSRSAVCNSRYVLERNSNHPSRSSQAIPIKIRQMCHPKSRVVHGSRERASQICETHQLCRPTWQKLRHVLLLRLFVLKSRVRLCVCAVCRVCRCVSCRVSRRDASPRVRVSCHRVCVSCRVVCRVASPRVRVSCAYRVCRVVCLVSCVSCAYRVGIVRVSGVCVVRVSKVCRKCVVCRVVCRVSCVSCRVCVVCVVCHVCTTCRNDLRNDRWQVWIQPYHLVKTARDQKISRSKSELQGKTR